MRAHKQLVGLVTEVTVKCIEYIVSDGRIKADSHIAWCAHFFSLPCPVAKGLDCDFLIWFTQCDHVWFTHGTPRTFCAPSVHIQAHIFLLNLIIQAILGEQYRSLSSSLCTGWFKYDRDWLTVMVLKKGLKLCF